MVQLQYRVVEIQPGLDMCKASTFPLVLSLQLQPSGSLVGQNLGEWIRKKKMTHLINAT